MGGVVSTLSLYLSLSLVLFGNHLTAFNSSIDGNASYTWHGANFGLLCLSMKLLATLTSKSRASYLDMETFHYLPFTFYHATTPLSDAFLVSWFGPRCHIPAVDLSSRPPPPPPPLSQSLPRASTLTHSYGGAKSTTATGFEPVLGTISILLRILDYRHPYRANPTDSTIPIGSSLSP